MLPHEEGNFLKPVIIHNSIFGDALHFLNQFVLIVRHWEVCKIPYKIKGIGREICSAEIVNRLEIDHIL